jgi:hypothetical protein
MCAILPPHKAPFSISISKNPSWFSHVFNFHMFRNTSDMNCSIYVYIYISLSWSFVESTIALGAKNNEIFFFSQFLWYQKLGEFFLKIRELSWIYTRKPHISPLFAQFLV